MIVRLSRHRLVQDSLTHYKKLSRPILCYKKDWDADDEEIPSPPTTHFVATIDDLTDMLDEGVLD